MSRSTQFQGHVAGVKTPRMLEVETRLGRTLEEDFAEYYVEKEWGQKKMSKRWGVTRTSIFGRYEKTTDLKSWVQVLQLPVRRDTPSSTSEAKRLPECEVCGVSGVPLEGAHWIAAAKGGDTMSSNIIKLCPNCHTKLDLTEDVNVTAQARAVLLVRVARQFIESRASYSRERQLRFVELCLEILSRGAANGT